jgi:hypothetical protein
MTLDGYTTAQLEDMHRAAWEDTSAAFDRVHDNLNRRFQLTYPSAEHAVLLAQFPVLKASAEQKHQHMHAIHLELQRRYAAADEAALNA